MNVCLSSFKDIRSDEMTKWLAVIKHELLHAFVFSESLYRKFVGVPESSSHDSTIPGVVKRVVREKWETASGFVRHEVYMIITPKVREEARKYFKCPSLEGAELENQFESEDIGSHWEKRVFEDEAMTGVTTQVEAVSRITLALLEDSGWYRVNYDNAEEMAWGRGLGCDFVKSSCLTWMKSHRANPYPFCTVFGDERCSENRMTKVGCNLMAPREDPPLEYNYNIENLYRDQKGNSVEGVGSVAQADYCPYYASLRYLTDSRCARPGKAQYSNHTLEVFSPTARCFNVGQIKIDNEFDIDVIYLFHTGCYEISCRDEQLLVKGYGTKFYRCKPGQTTHIVKHEPGIRNITAQIKCPPKSEVCHQKIRTAAPSRRMSTKTAPSSRTSPKPSMPLVSSSDQGKPIIFVISFLMLIFLCKRI